MITRPLIVGGSNGIGLAIATALAQRDVVEKVYIVDKVPVDEDYTNDKFVWFPFDLEKYDDYSFFEHFPDVNALIITAGFGFLNLFQDIAEEQIETYFKVNTIPVLRLIKKFYSRLQSPEEFYCAVMGSIAGFLPSPWLSVYGSTKAALKSFIESVNIELKKGGSENRILNVSPGEVKGTSFTGEKTHLDEVLPLAEQIIQNLEEKRDIYIPKYYEVYQEVLRRSQEDFRAEGERSYEYKKKRYEDNNI